MSSLSHRSTNKLLRGWILQMLEQGCQTRFTWRATYSPLWSVDQWNSPLFNCFDTIKTKKEICQQNYRKSCGPSSPPPPTGLPVMAVYWLKLMFWESPETSCRSDSIVSAKSCDLCAINNRCWLIPSWLMDHSLPVFLSSAVKLAHKKRCVNHWRQGAYHRTDPMTNTVDQPWEKAAGAD